MRDGCVGDRDVHDLARQAVDLLYPPATVTFPPCPGHEHPAQIDEADDTVILRCPDTGRAVAQLLPECDPT